MRKCSGQSVTVRSKTIKLQDGFQAKLGSTFNTFVDDCILVSTPNQPIGPLEQNKVTALLRKGDLADTVTYSLSYDYSNRSNIYRYEGYDISPATNEDAIIDVTPNPDHRESFC
jgi:hypothetical protein